jgi:hypothetical protein
LGSSVGISLPILVEVEEVWQLTTA